MWHTVNSVIGHKWEILVDISDYMNKFEKILISVMILISLVFWILLFKNIIVNAKTLEEKEVISFLDFRDEIPAPEIINLQVEEIVEDIVELPTYNMKITHYSPYCKGCIGITKHLEYDVRKNIYYQGMRVIAVDPRIIPLGSIVEMELPTGTIRAVALDIGGAIKGSKIDLLVISENEAYKLGVYNNVKVKIIGGI